MRTAHAFRSLLGFAFLVLGVIAAPSAGFGESLDSKAKSIVPEHELLHTANGIPVYFFPSPNLPLFELLMVYDGGSALDPEGKSGLGAIAAAMLKRGLPGLDENAVSRKLDDLAAGLDFAVEDEKAMVRAHGLTDHLDAVLELLVGALSKPSFPEAPFERIKGNLLDSIAHLPDSAERIAAHVLDLLVFNGTIKARPSAGFRADIQRVTLAEAKDYFPRLFRTDRLKVLVIGGKTREDVASKVMRALESLPCSYCGKPVGAPLAARPFRNPPPESEILLVRRPGITSAHIQMGLLGPNRLAPEFYDLRVAETILSGYFGSKMNQLLREKLNLTYGISAGFSFGDQLGAFVVETSTRNEKIGEMVVETRKLLSNFVAGEITEDELRMAKDYISGSFPLGLQNRYVIAALYFSGIVGGLSEDYLDRYLASIEAVTLRSLKAAVAKYLKLSQLRVVIAGDPKILGPKLKARGLKYRVTDPQVYL